MSRSVVSGFRKICMFVTVAMLSIGMGNQVSSARDRAGAVYVMNNQVTNAVQVFKRAPDGSLTPGGTFATGGAGAPTGNPFGNPFDPLASQGSVILSHDNHLLFVVNAGSNEISAFV